MRSANRGGAPHGRAKRARPPRVGVSRGGLLRRVDERHAGELLQLVEREAGADLAHGEAVAYHVEHREIGVDAIDAAHARHRIRAFGDDLAFALLRQVLHHHEHVLRADREIHRAADRGNRIGRARVPVREIAMRGNLERAEHAIVQMAASHHREGIRMMEVRAARKQRHVLLAGVDQFVVLRARRRGGTHAEQAVLAVQEDFPARIEVVRDERGHADAEVHIGAFGDVLRDALRHVVAGQSFHRVLLGDSGRARRALGRQFGRMRGLRHFDDALHEDAGRHDVFRIQRAERHDLRHLHDRRLRGHRHHRPEIARGLPIDEVAPAVAPVRLHEREIRMDRRLEHVVLAVDHARFLAFGELRAVARRREEAADTGARRANPLGEVALRYQFELDLARAIQRVEHLRIGLPRKRADDLAHAPRLQQRGEARLAVAGVVVDDRQIARALRDQRIDQLGGHPGRAEAADHDRRAVVDVGHRRLEGIENLVDHVSSYANPRASPAAARVRAKGCALRATIRLVRISNTDSISERFADHRGACARLSRQRPAGHLVRVRRTARSCGGRLAKRRRIARGFVERQADVVLRERLRGRARTRHVPELGELQPIDERRIVGARVQHVRHGIRKMLGTPYPFQTG
ncbi:hypothetical protein BURPS1710b_A1553 [Burkholderia pseudomallei 1710b]|uniref:Uncharacterized protein n=1 Tax=Burkholderia pseudomallei (strain 1710b) TaxID=320372 RepID=Q3JI94_BURP1|nr:hypothetical protein BURPS1710b_A1553 [Burkholderia pseudomallei 1710b]